MNCDNCDEYSNFLFAVKVTEDHSRDDGLQRIYDAECFWCVSCIKEEINKTNT
jgi:hypothetical protein